MDNEESRVEARAKVTGAARYAAEYKPQGLCYGVLVTSTIARGRILSLDTKKAKQAPGVLEILTHRNRPGVPGWNAPAGEGRVEGREFRVFAGDRIYFNHQPVALVIADSPERAAEAADLVRVTYQPEPHQTSLLDNISRGVKPKRAEDYRRGDPQLWQTAPVRLEAEYRTAVQVHNPLEMHAATVVWKGAGAVLDYNKTQASKIAQKDISTAFGLHVDQVEVHSPFVGGAFGSSSRLWPPEMAALLGAKLVNRPVVVMARRDQVFNLVGYRPASVQQVQIGAQADGTLVGLRHTATGSTSTYEEFTERITDPTRNLYACPRSGNTIVISHDVGGVVDAYRTIYMHLRNGASNDCSKSWSATIPTLSDPELTEFRTHLTETGCAQNPVNRNLNSSHWGTSTQKIDQTLLGKTVTAGQVIAWAGNTGPGGKRGSGGPNTHLHIFYARRDPTDNRWYFFDPYGIYDVPSCYPSGVTDGINTPCARYPNAWKGSVPQYRLDPSIWSELTTAVPEGGGNLNAMAAPAAGEHDHPHTPMLRKNNPSVFDMKPE